MREGFEVIEVIQCNRGCNQGMMNERGTIHREVHTLQLLESHFSIVSGIPGARMGKFVDVNGTLREVKWQTGFEEENVWRVTLHGDEELPSDLFTPTTELEL